MKLEKPDDIDEQNAAFDVNTPVHVKQEPEYEVKEEIFIKEEHVLPEYLKCETREIKSEQEPYQCLICQRTFTSEKGVQIHSGFHYRGGDHSCEKCGKRYRLRSKLRKHLREHEKPFECHCCGQCFAKKDSLIPHIRLHTLEKPFRCDMCEARFGRKDALKKHSLIHKGVTDPYICHICGKKFIYGSSLNSHMFVHAPKQFSCSICQKYFNRKDSLKDHLTIHTGDNKFECDTCRKVIKWKGNFLRHMQRHAEL